MARVNVYGTIQGDNRTVTIGGRSSNDWARASLNTDNGAESDVSASMEAQVTGNLRAKDRTKRNGGDNRRSQFTFNVPSVNAPESTDVLIVVPTLDAAPARLDVSIGGTVVPLRELWAAWSAQQAAK